MRRSLDPAPFNRIFNEPSVRPWMGYGLEPADLTGLVTDPANYCLLTPNSDGAYIVARLDPGLYVAHTLALPSARGKPMLKLMQDGFCYLFTATDAIEITTLVPDSNPAADRWAGIAGFRETFRREAFFPLAACGTVGGSFRSLTYGDWVLRHNPNRSEGEAFHAKLHAASPSLADHPHDPVHDAWVGATIAGVRQGNVAKAVSLFNRWAAQAGYQRAQIVSEKPAVIHTGDAILTMIGGEVEVLKAMR